ncbi:MAG: twin-arginine translocase TatA/TatE family subunit [Pirellulaceae bacterium]
MFGIGQTELLVIGFVVLILFGHRLPELMGGMGTGIRRFKQALNQEDHDEVPATVEKRT